MNLITDRTQFDVDRWRLLHDRGWALMSTSERNEWLGEMKGRYGYTDMNRVEEAVAALSRRLTELGYNHSELTVKTDWSHEDIPTVEDFKRYYGNVETLRRASTIYPSTPVTPTVAQNLNYSRANDLEQIILDINEITTILPNTWYYAGEIFSGEV